jgi:hypothetical protein
MKVICIDNSGIMYDDIPLYNRLTIGKIYDGTLMPKIEGELQEYYKIIIDDKNNTCQYRSYRFMTIDQYRLKQLDILIIDESYSKE